MFSNSKFYRRASFRVGVLVAFRAILSEMKNTRVFSFHDEKEISMMMMDEKNDDSDERVE